MQSTKNPAYADLSPKEVNALLLGRTVQELEAEGWSWNEGIWLPPIMHRGHDTVTALQLGTPML